MALVHTAFLHFLRDDDRASALATLRAATDGLDAAAARASSTVDPASAEAAAGVLTAAVLEGASAEIVVEVAKSIAGRAPRDEAGHEVIALVGETVWRFEGQQAAEPFYRRLRRSDPSSAEVLAFYRELFRDEPAQLIQVLVQARRASRDPDVRLQLAHDVADIAETRTNSPDRAIEVWRGVVREDGPHPEAFAALKRLYREGEKWTALVELLKDELERLPEDATADRIERLLEISTLYRDRLRLDTMALATLQRVLELDPTHEESLEALAETHARAGRFNELLGVYERRIKAADAEGHLDQQTSLRRKVAQLWVERLGNPQRALEPLRELLRLSPDDRGARELMAQIHEQRRDFRALIALRREELEQLDGERALELRIELAILTEDKLGDRKEAIEAWNEVLAHHGEVDRALAALARLYERESRWTSAAEILHRKLGYCTRPEAVRLLQHLGTLYSDRIGHRAAAIAVWSELLRLVPGHDKALRRLRDAYVVDRRWDELTALFDEQERLLELVDVLHGAADRVEDVQERVDLYRRVAALCQGRLAQPERALKALERTLAIQPDNLDVARELVPIYREQGNWARLLSVYEVLLRGTEEPSERLRLLAAAQDITQSHLNAPTLTFQFAVESYLLRPTDPELRAQLELAAERADGWDELTRVFETRLSDAAVDDVERLLLLEKLAVVARDRLFKPDDAQRYFRRIIALDGNNRTAITALEDIYSQTRRFEDLAEVYRRRLDVTEDHEGRQSILRRLAAIEEAQLGDLDAAVRSHEALLELDPSDIAALDRLIEIHRKRGSWASLADALQRRLEFAAHKAIRVPLVVELAQVQADHLGIYREAANALLAVLDMIPDHAMAVGLLEQLRVTDPSLTILVMRGLLPVYRRMGARDKEAEAIEVLLAHEDDAAAKRTWMEQLAALYEQSEEWRPKALALRRDLFLAFPHQWQARRKLLELAGELELLDTVADAYRQVLSDDSAIATQAGAIEPGRERSQLRRDLLLEHAAFLRDRLGNAAQAEQAYAEVLELDETHQGAYESLETLLRAREAHRELVALYRRRADVTFNQREQRQLLSQIISLSRDVLGDRERAIATAEELLDLIPDDRATLELLSEMYAQGAVADDYAKLEQVLGRRVELLTATGSAEDRERARRLQVQRAETRMQYLGDAAGAVDLLGQVVAEDPDDAAAKRLLEELLTITEVKLETCALLDPLYRRDNNHQGRIRLLNIRREHAEALGVRDEAINHLVEIARIYFEAENDRDRSFLVLCEALLMEPLRTDVRRKAERIGQNLARFEDLVRLWERLLADSRCDEALRVELMASIARTQDQDLRDPEAARDAFERLLAADPPDVALAREATEALCRLHFELGDWVAWIDAKRRSLRFCNGREEQVRLRLELAETLRDLRDRVEAALMYGEVLDLDPSNAVALDALEALFAEEHEWAHLAALLEHRVGVTTEPRRKAALWRQLGQLREKELGDAVGALAAYQSVLDLKVGRDDSRFALQAIVALHERAGRHADVEDGLRRLLMLAETDHERCELLTRTAVVIGRELGRGMDALEVLKRVLDLMPTDAAARAEVSRYLDADETRERTIRILTPLYEAEQNWPALLELEELQARKQPSGRRRLQALLKVARTHEERLADHDRAFSVLCEALAEAADQPELESILDKLDELGTDGARAERLLEAYASTAEHILDAALQRRVFASWGAVALERLDDAEGARDAYERVLEQAPHDREAQDALELICLRLEDFARLSELLVNRAEREDDVTRRDDALVRAAEIRRTQLHDGMGALELYHRLSSDGLSRPEVQVVLEPLYEETGLFRELASHLNRRLATVRGPQAVDIHLRLGRLYGQHLADRQTAMTHLSTALKLDPSHAVATQELDRYLEDPSMRMEAVAMLEPVFASIAAWDRLIALQQIRAALATDDAERLALALRIAQIEEEQLEDLDRAFATYERLFHEQPDNAHVRDQLARLAGVLGQQARYATLLTDYVEGPLNADESEATLELVQEVAHLWAVTLRSPERAVPLLRRLLAARPDDPNHFVALESALTQAEMWDELAQAYWREAEDAVEEGRQLEFLRKLAVLAEELLENPDETLRAYRRILAIRPDDDDARVRLERIVERLERHEQLLELLLDRLARAHTPVQRKWINLRIAELQAEHLADWEGAATTLEAALVEAPDDGSVIGALERLAERAPEIRGRVLMTLRPVYERLGDLKRLVEIDEWQLGQTEDPAGRHELYLEMANLLLRGNSSEAAFHTLCRALAEPGPEEALLRLDDRVAALARRASLQRGLAEARRRASQAPALEDDVDRRVELLLQAADLLLDLGDFPATAEVAREATTLWPEFEPALVLLDRALSELGDEQGLVEVLAQRVEVSVEDPHRLALLRRLARLEHDALRDHARAEGTWRRLLELHPTDREALRRLAEIHRHDGATEALTDVLERLVDSSDDVDERRTLRLELAECYRKTDAGDGNARPGRRDREVDVLQAILLELPEDDEVLALLTEVLVAEERFGEAVEMLALRAQQSTDDQKLVHWLRAARLLRGPLQDLHAALELYRKILALSPTHDETARDLVELITAPHYDETAVALVVPVLESTGRQRDLDGVLAVVAEHAVEPQERVQALRRLVRLRSDVLDEPAQAYAAAKQLLTSVDDNQLTPTLDEASRLAVRLGEGPEYIRLVAQCSTAPERTGAPQMLMLLHAAKVAEEVLGQPKMALELLAPQVDNGTGSAELYRQVERLGRNCDDLAIVVGALEELARSASEPAAQAEALVRLGQTHVERDEDEAAFEAFAEAFELVASDAALAGLEGLLERSEKPSERLLELLETAYRSRGEPQQQARIIRVRLQHTAAADELPVLESLGTVCDEGGGTSADSLHAWARVLAHDIHHFVAADRIIALAREPALAAAAAAALEKAMEAARGEGTTVPTSLSVAAASMLLRDLGDPSRALQLARLAIEEHSEQPELLHLYVEAARATSDAAVLHEALAHAAANTAAPDESAGLWWDAASVAETGLSDLKLAITDLERALEVDEDQTRAWSKLLSLLATTGDYERLALALERRIATVADSAQRRDLRHRLAHVYVERQDRVEDAVAVYQDMLTDNVGDNEAAAELERLLRHLERWADVVDLLERKLEIAVDVDRQLVLEELASLAEHALGDKADAIERYQQLLLEHPGHKAAEVALERLLRDDDRWVELSELLENRVQRLREAGDGRWREVTCDLAIVLAEHLLHPERAQELLGELLEEEPPYVPALVARAVVFDSMGESESMREMLQLALDQGPQGREGAEVHLRLSRLTDDPAKRREHLEAAIELDPTHEQVGSELVWLCKEQARWEQVSMLLDTCANRAADEDARRAFLLERVDVLLERLQDAEAALRLLAPLYRQIQDDLEINRRIADALFAAERFDEAAGMYNWLVAVDRRNRRNKTLAHHLTRLARIAMRKEDSNGAREHLLEAYRIDTTNVETLLTLGNIYERGQEWQEALKIYRAMLLQNAERSSQLRRGDIYLRIAKAHLALDESAKAKSMLRRGLEEDASHPELGQQLAALGG